MPASTEATRTHHSEGTRKVFPTKKEPLPHGGNQIRNKRVGQATHYKPATGILQNQPHRCSHRTHRHTYRACSHWLLVTTFLRSHTINVTLAQLSLQIIEPKIHPIRHVNRSLLPLALTLRVSTMFTSFTQLFSFMFPTCILTPPLAWGIFEGRDISFLCTAQKSTQNEHNQ